MRSKTSLYDFALGKSLLKRCWPLWALWLCVLIFAMPVNTAGEISRYIKTGAVDPAADLAISILNTGIEFSWLAVIVCPVAVLLMFSFLYTSRGSGMIACLPLKRETVFITCFLTGLVPMLIAELIAALVTFALCGGSGMLDSAAVWKWLWMLVSSTTAFYGIASFCAVLTGSFIILPLAYIVLNLAPYLAYSGICTTLETLLYGYSFHESELFTKLSPFLGLESVCVNGEYIYSNGQSRFNGSLDVANYELFGYYCIAGLVLAVIALLIFRKRRMESAGDIVAVRLLRPVFKYCLALAGACSFAPLMYAMIFRNATNGGTTGVLTIVSLAVGGFIGYYAAEMLLNKTVNVFHGHWKGFIIFTLIIVLLAVGVELDVFGFERYVPDAAEVESVVLGYSMDTEYRQPENIARITDLHRQIIDSKGNNERISEDYDYLGLEYTLKNGNTVTRSYKINREVNGEINPDLRALDKVINLPEAINSRISFPAGLTADDIDSCTIYGYYVNDDNEQSAQHYELSSKQAVDLYENCIVPDAAEGHMLRLWPVQDDEYMQNRSTLYVEYVLGGAENSARRWKEFIIYMDAERCCDWISENAELRLQSLDDVQKLDETLPRPVN